MDYILKYERIDIYDQLVKDMKINRKINIYYGYEKSFTFLNNIILQKDQKIKFIIIHELIHIKYYHYYILCFTYHLPLVLSIYYLKYHSLLIIPIIYLINLYIMKYIEK